MNTKRERESEFFVSRRLIEEQLPLKEVNKNGGMESWFIRAPKIANLHPWSARRPCGVARALTAASLLPSSEDSLKNLDEIIGLTKAENVPYGVIYLVKTDRELFAKLLEESWNRHPNEIIVVDPMAGGGSIPLASLRLGLKTVAMEYNPVAYILLKATLEYPAKYGETLYEDLRKEVKTLIKYAKSELGKYYPQHVENYIFARGFVCPNCRGLVPVIHSVRLGKKGPYIKFNFNKKEKTFEVEIVESKTKFEKLKCPYCSRPFTRQEVLNWWESRNRELLKLCMNGDKRKAKEEASELLRIHIPLVKQIFKGKEREIVPCDEEDGKIFVRAYLDLASQITELKPFIPNAPIPRENQVFGTVKKYGIEYWRQFFNPRQLLVLAKLIEYVNKKGLVLIDEKKEYGAAIAIYLALGISKIMNYNNITTTWDSSTKTVRELMDHYARTRAMSLGLEYCEIVVPLEKRSLGWTYEPDIKRLTTTHGGICPVVRELASWTKGLSDRIRIYMANALQLSKTIGEENVDVINVDPPYFNQHYYSDTSEFFWQILRLALKPLIDSGYLFNRDERRGRVECLVSGWTPILPTVPRNEELIVRKTTRKMVPSGIQHTAQWYEKNMWRFFGESHKALDKDGVLIVWYTHSSPEAWVAVLSGLYASGFMLTRIWTVRTEMAQRRIALAGSAFFTSMALVARKEGRRVIVGERTPEDLLANQQVERAIATSVEEALHSAEASEVSARETFIMALAGAIAGSTKIRNPSIETIQISRQEPLSRYISSTDEFAEQRFNTLSHFFRKSLYPVALYLGASKVLEEELAKAGLSQDETKLVVGSDNYTKAYLVFWLSTRYSEEAYVDYDFAEKICKVIGVSIDGLKIRGLIAKLKKDTYQILYGQEAFIAVKNRIETLGMTVAGETMYLLKLIVDSPIKDDAEKCARQVLKVKPISKQVVATAIFLLRTAKEKELRKASISPYTKPFVEKVLASLYAR